MQTRVYLIWMTALVPVSACAPDSSLGPDTVNVSGGASGARTIQGGSGTGGTSAPGAGTGGTATAAGAAGSSPSGAGGSSGSGTAGLGGAAGPSGGASGAAMGGGAGQGGPSLCPIAGTTLCDGFEGAAPGAANGAWTISGAMSPDTMVVDAAKFYRGSKSMHFSAATQAYIVASKIFAGTTKASNNNLWGRYFVLSGVAAAATYSQSHVVFGALADAANSGNQFHFVGGSRGKLQAEIRLTSDAYTDSMSAPAAADPAYPLAGDGWQCWEWHVQADDSFDFYINGTEVPEMKITAGKAVMSKATFAPMPVFGGLYLGWQSFSGGSAISGWIDEVAVGPNRIGCGN